MRPFSAVSLLIILGVGAGLADASEVFRVNAGGNLDWFPVSGGFDKVSSSPVADDTTMADTLGTAQA